MDDVKDFDLVSADSIDNSLRLFDQFANISTTWMVHHAARKRNTRKLVASFQDVIDNAMSIRFRVSRDMRVDRSKRPERPV